jgi:ABC-type glycerol-3-phosphate transport system permease component
MRSDRQAQGALATEWQSTSADLQAESALQRRRGESSRTAWDTIRLVVLQLFMTFLVITFLVPTFWMISSSLKVSTEVFAHPIVWLPQDPHWNNYVKAFQLLPLTRFIVNTLIIVLFAVIGTVISSALVAYSFARISWPGRNFWFALLLATMMLPDVVTLVPRFLIFKNLKWIDTWLPLIVPYWAGIGAIYVFLMRQFFMTIPRELDDSAMIDGCNPIGLFWRIHLPLSLPALGVVLIFMVTAQWNDFLYPLIYIQGVNNYTVALGLRLFEGHMTNNMQALMAASILGVLPTIILFFFAQRYFVQGIVVSGVKG